VSGALDVPGTGLPVEAALASVRAALDERGTAVLIAPPGSGKTTVVPLHLVGQPWANGRIVVLEPRRIAARAAARRMAELLGEPLGQTVGYRTRDERKVSGATQVEVITEGILVRRLQRDPSLPGIAAVLLDEVHERNLVTDLSLALSLDVRRSLRPDLRLLAMSATIDADRLAGVLGDAPGPAPVVRSDAERHELTVLHRPAAPRERLDAHVARVVGEVLAAAPVGDVLVFLPGAADIRRVAARLTTAAGLPAAVDVLPLHGSLPSAAQDAALAPSGPGRRRVVLATDIAESSLTVAGVRIVVDAGSARVPVIDGATGLSVLRTEPASTASVEQRAGRAARLGPGVSVRLWDDAQVRRPAAPTPEVLLADLTGLALELAVWGAEVDDLPFPDPPPAARLAQGRAVLAAIGAIDVAGRPTATGRRIAELPLHPRLGALVLAGVDQGVGATACALAALLAERDVVRGGVDAPVDLAARVELVVDGTSSALGPELVDRRALDAVRRTARRLARTVGVDATAVAPDRCGSLLAVAFPERLAQAQGDGRFRLRGGGGGAMPTGDALARSPYLVVADLEGGRIRRAAAIDDAPGARDRGRRRHERGGVGVGRGARRPARPPAGTVGRTRARCRGGSAHAWSRDGGGAAGAGAGHRRVGAAVDGGCSGHPRPGGLRPPPGSRSMARCLRCRALLAELDTWLGSHLLAATGRVDLERLDLVMLLWHRIGHHRRHELDRLAPTSFEAVDGRAIPIAYDGDRPRSSVRAQQLFGLAHHPTVGDGQVPVVLELLSPAGRPVQVTADLPGFWAGTWAEVRKDLAGRYPKHPWPADPSSSSPPSRRPRRPGR
jgi:ATP-dependent helicase HrpB